MRPADEAVNIEQRHKLFTKSPNQAQRTANTFYWFVGKGDAVSLL